MEWCVLVLILSLPSSIQADCSSQCLNCAQQMPNVDMSINSLTCTLECEGIFPSTAELDKCEKALHLSSAGHVELGEGDESAPDGSEASPGNVAKRYGGFIKRIDKSKIYGFPGRENALLKGLFARKSASLARKVAEREAGARARAQARDPSRDAGSRGALPERDEERDAGIEEAKRYGGFFRKFVPKRSEESAEDGDGDEDGDEDGDGLQKRYGGFMRRIRPKLKWNNQKRYGGFLRRHFKISVRSDEEPNSYDGADL